MHFMFPLLSEMLKQPEKLSLFQFVQQIQCHCCDSGETCFNKILCIPIKTPAMFTGNMQVRYMVVSPQQSIQSHTTHFSWN